MLFGLTSVDFNKIVNNYTKTIFKNKTQSILSLLLNIKNLYINNYKIQQNLLVMSLKFDLELYY